MGAANNGAGGSGLLGIGSVYFDEGVPGLGDPLISADSYLIGDAGRLDELEFFLEGERECLSGEFVGE